MIKTTVCAYTREQTTQQCAESEEKVIGHKRYREKKPKKKKRKEDNFDMRFHFFFTRLIIKLL